MLFLFDTFGQHDLCSVTTANLPYVNIPSHNTVHTSLGLHTPAGCGEVELKGTQSAYKGQVDLIDLDGRIARC